MQKKSGIRPPNLNIFGRPKDKVNLYSLHGFQTILLPCQRKNQTSMQRFSCHSEKPSKKYKTSNVHTEGIDLIYIACDSPFNIKKKKKRFKKVSIGGDNAQFQNLQVTTILTAKIVRTNKNRTRRSERKEKYSIGASE